MNDWDKFFDNLYSQYNIPQDTSGTNYWLGQVNNPKYQGLTTDQKQDEISKSFASAVLANQQKDNWESIVASEYENYNVPVPDDLSWWTDEWSDPIYENLNPAERQSALLKPLRSELDKNQFIRDTYEKEGLPPPDDEGLGYWLGEGGFGSDLYDEAGFNLDQIKESIAKNIGTNAYELEQDRLDAESLLPPDQLNIDTSGIPDVESPTFDIPFTRPVDSATPFEHDEMGLGRFAINTGTPKQDHWNEQFANTYGSRINDLTLSSFNTDNIIDRYKQISTRDRTTPYGEKSDNVGVKEVRFQNELPGYGRQGRLGLFGHNVGGVTSFFNRGTGTEEPIKTIQQSINIGTEPEQPINTSQQPIEAIQQPIETIQQPINKELEQPLSNLPSIGDFEGTADTETDWRWDTTSESGYPYMDTMINPTWTKQYGGFPNYRRTDEGYVAPAILGRWLESDEDVRTKPWELYGETSYEGYKAFGKSGQPRSLNSILNFTSSYQPEQSKYHTGEGGLTL